MAVWLTILLLVNIFKGIKGAEQLGSAYKLKNVAAILLA